MAKFEAAITRIRAIEPIEGADAIELAVVGDYRSVVRKGAFTAGELVVYIPEGAILPEPLIVAMGLEGRLAGSEKNRVKAVKLRGCLSQGLLLHPRKEGYEFLRGLNDHYEGQDCTEVLGVTKYEPVIPANMAGEVYNAGQRLTVAYDIENFKKYPDVLRDGEEVVMTEKLHGTFTGLGILPRSEWDDKHYRNKFVVFSKGLGADGLCFKHNEANANNLYVRTLEKLGVFDKLEKFMDTYPSSEPLFVLGETFGTGVQDLTYGTKAPTFRVFDVATGFRNTLTYADYDFMCKVAFNLDLPTVPLVYRGPFDKQVLLEHTSGQDNITGTNMREGVVVKPTHERTADGLGRVILKSVSEAYLLRKHGTELQ